MKVARSSMIAAFLAASSLLVASSSRADLVALPSNLAVLTTAGNFTTVGDKTFEFISYTNTQNPLGGGDPIAADSIAVGALSGFPTSPVAPFGFELSGPLAAIPNTKNSNDILLNYTVTSSGPGITAVNLFGNGSTTGSGFAEIVEAVFVNDHGVKGAFLGQISVLGAGTATLELPTAQASLFIVKDIQFNVLGATGTATYSAIDQSFSQGVPEPASIAMTGLGLAAALGAGRLRRMGLTAQDWAAPRQSPDGHGPDEHGLLGDLRHPVLQQFSRATIPTRPGDIARHDHLAPPATSPGAQASPRDLARADRDLGPREAVWSLVVRGEPIEGRFALRAGEVGELAEDAE